MNSLVRIVKREKVEASQRLQPEADEKKTFTEQEIASTIKSWITDWKQRRVMTEQNNWDMLTRFAQ